jgi:hypothetical protein
MKCSHTAMKKCQGFRRKKVSKILFVHSLHFHSQEIEKRERKKKRKRMKRSEENIFLELLFFKELSIRSLIYLPVINLS